MEIVGDHPPVPSMSKVSVPAPWYTLTLFEIGCFSGSVESLVRVNMEAAGMLDAVNL